MHLSSLKRSPPKIPEMPIDKVKLIEASQHKKWYRDLDGVLGITKKTPALEKEDIELGAKKRINIYPGKVYRKKIDIRINGLNSTFLKQIEHQAWNIITKTEITSETNLLQCFKENLHDSNTPVEEN